MQFEITHDVCENHDIATKFLHSFDEIMHDIKIFDGVDDARLHDCCIIDDLAIDIAKQIGVVIDKIPCDDDMTSFFYKSV